MVTPKKMPKMYGCDIITICDDLTDLILVNSSILKQALNQIKYIFGFQSIM